MVEEKNTAPTIVQDEEHPIEEQLSQLEQEMELERKEGVWKKIKDFLINFLIAIILLGLSWVLVGLWTIPIAIAMFLGTFFYTKYIYKPPSIPVAVVGENEPNHPESGVRLNLWLVPKSIWNESNVYGLATPVKTSMGMAYVAEEFDYDQSEKKLRIVFQWVHLSVLNFLTNFKIFHTIRVANKTLAEENNTLKMMIDGMTVRKAMEIADAKIKLLQNESTGFGEKGKTDELQLWNEILEKAKIEQKIITKSLRKNPVTGQVEIPEEEAKMQSPEE
jgi:hypothetical protein